MIDLYQQFEDYARGDLKSPEAETWMQSLTETEKAALKEYLLIRKNMKPANSKVPTSLKSSLDTLGQEYFSEDQPKVVKRLPLRLMSIAAAVLILAGAYFAFNQFNQTSWDKDALVESNFYSKKSDIITRGEGRELTTMEQGIMAYESQDYKTAINLLKSLDWTVPENFHGMYCLGNAYLKNGDTGLALGAYSQIVDENSEIKPYVQWNQMLGYLKLEDVDRVHEILDAMIKDPKHIFNAKARALKKEIV